MTGKDHRANRHVRIGMYSFQAAVRFVPGSCAPSGEALRKMHSSPGEHRETLRHTALVFGATAFVNAANFGFHFGAIRLLGLQTYSALAAMLALVLICSVPANVLQAVVTVLAGESIGRDPGSAGALNRSVIKLALIAGGGIVLVGSAFAPLLKNYLDLRELAPAFFAILVIAFGFAAASLRGLLQGEQRFGVLAASLICEAGGNLIFGLTLIVLWGGLHSAIFGNVCGVAGGFLFCLGWARKTASANHAHLDMRRVLAKSIGTTLALGGLAAMSWADIILVRHFLPPATAGIYSALSIVGRVVIFSIAFIPLVLIAKAAKLSSQKRTTAPLLMMMLLAGLSVCLIELTLIRFVPALILAAIAGKAAIAATPYMLRYGVAITALALTTIVANYGIGTHRFAFVVPLIAIELLEIGAITVYHGSIDNVISVLIAGHCSALALTVTALLLDGRMRRPFPAVR